MFYLADECLNLCSLCSLFPLNKKCLYVIIHYLMISSTSTSLICSVGQRNCTTDVIKFIFGIFSYVDRLGNSVISVCLPVLDFFLTIFSYA